MAASKTYFARPVFMASKGEQLNSRTAESISMGSSKPKTTHFTSLENTDPPPRPPPPRPSLGGAPKGNVTGSKIQSIKRQLPLAPNPSSEQKPLTRLNVTSLDRLWQKDSGDENACRSNGLSPPLNHITKESTEEMIRNFDPCDLEAMSDHSDASADTMIMMTTEEELKNQEKINHSLKQYASKKFQQEKPDTSKSKTNTHSKKNMHIHFADMNGTDINWQHVPNGIAENSEHGNKISPLHIKTDPYSNREYRDNSVSSKPNTTHSSPSDSPDDGYGTNSSTGTVSSPFSSSFGSNDFENSYNGGIKKCFLPNGAIKPNSVRESWAVRRKQRMIEAQDNSVQEQLRQLTIIEEELTANQNSNKNLKSSHFGTIKHSEQKTGFKETITFDNNDEDPQFVNVSQSDLHRVNQQLVVVSNDNEAHAGNKRQERLLPQTPTSQDLPYNQSSQLRASQFPADNVTYAVPLRRRSKRNDVVSDNDRNTFASSRRPCIEDTEPKVRNGLVHQAPSVDRQTYAWEEASEATTDSMGPVFRRAAVESNQCTAIGSGKIYQSANGDEGFYSLNRSSRSTSVSSFLPVNEPSETGLGAVQNEGPRSPLEALSGEMLEKFSEMDMNYRNFNGFDDKNEIFSRTDSKVNYFQDKQINRMYRSDNLPRTQEYGSDDPLQQTCVQSETMSRRSSTRQASKSDSKQETSKSSSSSKQEDKGKAKHDRETDSSSKGSKLFQILPNMFKPSNKKANKGIKDKDSKESKTKRKLPVPLSVPVKEINEERPSEVDDYEQAEYINMSDLPQYSLASIEYEEKLRKGQYVSLESLNKRPVFASSRDIQKLFSTHDQSFDSINSHGTQRHSFHAMPLSYRHHMGRNTSADNMRPRAASESASTRTNQLQHSVENHMALIARKNAAVMLNAQDEAFGSQATTNLHHSTTLSQRSSESRARLDSGSSGGDSKLSTLV